MQLLQEQQSEFNWFNKNDISNVGADHDDDTKLNFIQLFPSRLIDIVSYANYCSIANNSDEKLELATKFNNFQDQYLATCNKNSECNSESENSDEFEQVKQYGNFVNAKLIELTTNRVPEAQTRKCNNNYSNSKFTIDNPSSTLGKTGTYPFYTKHRSITTLNLFLISIVTLLAISVVQNALLCSGSRRVKRFDVFGLNSYDYNPYYNTDNRYYQSSLAPNYWQPPQKIFSLFKRSNPMNNNDHFTTIGPNSYSLSNDQSRDLSESMAPASADALQSMYGSDLAQQDTLDQHIRKILIPRVSGTPGNVEVRNYIVSSLKKNNYHVELDEFSDSTPIGDVKFANIIADSNPNACRQLVLACHYDSKLMDGFLGATDSAVPCAMLLKMSETFKDSYRSDSEGENQKDSLGLRFIFFDGEEAFDQWGPYDSLYGSRHLAAKWEKQPGPKQCGNMKNELKRLEMLMVLDLIGTSDTTFCMYNRQLSHQYQALMRHEKAHIQKQGLSNNRGSYSFKNIYHPLRFFEDDHIPFMQRGVPVLSLLANPFPKVWHTIADNYTAIDFPRTRHILHVLEEYVRNYRK